MNKNHAILIVLLALSVGAFIYLSNYHDTPRAPPTWGWTKIATATIETNYKIDGTPVKEVTIVNLSINVKKQYEEKIIVLAMYSGGTPIARATLVTHVTGGTATLSKTYSDTTTHFSTTTKIPVFTTFNTPLSITLISSRDGETYYGTYNNDTITYTYTYAGDGTWVGFYTTTITYGDQTITGVYTATIVQK